MSIYKRQLAVFVFAIFFVNTVSTAAADSNSSTENGGKNRKAPLSISDSVIVKARPEFLWWSLHEARTKEPGFTSSKILSEKGDNSVLRQTFKVPLLGEVTCTLALADSPPNRSDYKLIQSDTFSKFDGSWTLTPCSDGKSTKLGLSCDACPKRAVPQFLLRIVIAKKIKKRLDFIKALAEQKEAQAQAATLEGKHR
jgi:hypothetical protein